MKIKDLNLEHCAKICAQNNCCVKCPLRLDEYAYCYYTYMECLKHINEDYLNKEVEING